MEKRRVGKTQLAIDVLGLGGAPLGGNFTDLNFGRFLAIMTAISSLFLFIFDVDWLNNLAYLCFSFFQDVFEGFKSSRFLFLVVQPYLFFPIQICSVIV